MKSFLLKSKFFATTLVIMNLFIAATAFGQTTYYLTTAGQAAPQTAGNWNTGGIAGGGTAATVFTGATDVFIVAPTITATYPPNVTGTFAGTLQVDGLVVIGDGSNNSTTTLTVNGTVVFNATTNQVTFGTSGGGGNNTFVLGAAGTLKTKNSTGVLGTNCSITLNGARTAATLPTTANYEFNNGGNQTMTGIPATVNNLTLSGSGIKTLSAITVNGILSVEGTATTAGTSPAYGVTASLQYKGSAAQTTSSTEFIATVPNLIIDNTSGVTLNASKTVSGTLTLTNGNLTIPSANRLTLSGTGAIAGSGFSAAKSVVTQVNTGTGAKGFLRVIIPAGTLRSIPVSDGTNYLPVDLTPANANTYDVCVFNGVTNNGEPNGVAFTPTQKTIVVDAEWYINLITGTAGAGVTMTTNWPTSLEGSSFTNYTGAQIGISHYDNVTPGWELCLGSGDNVANTATRTAIVTFSPFGVGRVNSPLPVSISYFNAAKGSGFNTLNWQAACSTDNAVFEIERSADGRNFTTINTITATRAQCAQSVNYVDNTNLTGTVFYRIKSVDVNGKASYSVIIKLGAQQNDMKFAGVLPNPVSNMAQLNIVIAKKDNVELAILSMEGKVVQRSTVQLQPGSSIISLDVTNLQKGLYIIKGIFGDGGTSSIKFVKQ